MQRVVQTRRFGPHHVDVLEIQDDEGPAGYLVVIDRVAVTDAPIPHRPTEEDVVRLYAAWREGRAGQG